MRLLGPLLLAGIKNARRAPPLLVLALSALVLVGANIVPAEALIGFCSSVVVSDNPHDLLRP